MPLNIDVAFKWGEQKKKKEEPTTTSPTSTTASSLGTTTHSSDLTSLTTTNDLELNPTQISEQQPQGELISPSLASPLSTKRLIVIVRHAERMDRVFPSWLKLANSNGSYRPYNANQPRQLPQRRGGLGSFFNDSPLTCLGQTMATMRGTSMDYVQFRPATVFTSPALRCVETAILIARALSVKVKICVEPGLFDWTGWYVDGVPVWMSVDELIKAGYGVDRRYQPIRSVESMMSQKSETKHEFYHRTQSVVQHINKHSRGDVLIVSHATTLDAGVRALLGLPLSVPKFDVLDHLDSRYPCCSSVVLEQTTDREHFQLGKPLHSITTTGSSAVLDKKFLLRQ